MGWDAGYGEVTDLGRAQTGWWTQTGTRTALEWGWALPEMYGVGNGFVGFPEKNSLIMAMLVWKSLSNLVGIDSTSVIYRIMRDYEEIGLVAPVGIANRTLGHQARYMAYEDGIAALGRLQRVSQRDRGSH